VYISRSIRERACIDAVQAVALQMRNPRRRIRAPSWGVKITPGLEGAFPMIIELGKVAVKTKGTDIGLKLDSNVGAKIQRYSVAF
jgi:hypothetical protein